MLDLTAVDPTTEPETSTENAPADDAPELSPVQSLMERLRAKFGDNPTGEEPESTDAPESTEEAPGTPEKAEEPTKDDKPAEKPAKEPVDPLELRHADLQEEFRSLKADHVAVTKRAETAEGELQALKSSAKANPLAALEELTGMSLQEIMAKGARGEFNKAKPAEVPEEFREAIEFFKAQKAKEQEIARAAERDRALKDDAPKLRAFLESHAADFPHLLAFPSAAEDVLHELYDRMDRGEKPNLREMIADIEKTSTANFAEFFSNKALFAHQLANNSVFKSLVDEAARSPASKSKPAAQHASRVSPVPATVPTNTEITARTAPDDEEAENAESLRLAREWRAARGR